MSKSKPFPEIPPGLMKRLEEAFPDRVLRGSDSSAPEDWYRQQGTQHVMDLLRKQYEKQQERQVHVPTAT